MRILLQAIVVVAIAPNVLAKAPPQLITVVTPDWKATTGELRRWQRDGKGWRQVGTAFPVVVGERGLKWSGDKRENDLASPAGRMTLGEAFGSDDKAPAGATLPYRRGRDWLFVDDPRHPELRGREIDLRRHEPEDVLGVRVSAWRYAIHIRHDGARVPHQDSLFLRVWYDARTPTPGDTAMALDDMRTLLQWATPSTELVQLPRAEYEKRQREWDLPAQRK